ncbi:MAG: hypothetical protein ACLVH9_08405 [Fusobacterium sp.]|uniref:hypothetical protein n=1 Tax=Fusobacterium sp. TaxID=68766 RepID=UPI003999BA6A
MKRIGLAILLLLNLTKLYGNDFSTFSISDKMIYFEENENEREGIYTLKIKGQVCNFSYPVINENGEYYLSLFSFFESIGFTNYEKGKGKVILLLGENNVKKEINFNKMKEKKDYFFERGEYYLNSKIFKEYLLEDYRLDREKLILNIIPNFTLPEEIGFIIDAREQELLNKKAKNTLYYKGNRKLIDAGNVRVNLEQTFDNSSGAKKSSDWDGYLEYSGSFLYGNLITDYDLKEKKFGDFEITYSDLLEDYKLEVGIYGEDREKGLSFKKDKGYFDNGREYIIREDVPLGSRAELLYNEIPIEIEYEENGQVVFANTLLKDGREFLIRIYAPDGKIYERTIKINEDYNQQEKGEFGYDIYIRENKELHRTESEWNIYYGYTNNLTLGFGYNQTPTLLEGKYLSEKSVSTELIYSDMFYRNPFTFDYEFTKGLNTAKNSFQAEESKYIDKKYNWQHKFLFDTDIKKLHIDYEHYENGKYYDARQEQYLDLEYDLTDSISLIYNLENKKFYGETEKERDYYYGLEFSDTWKSLLVSYDLEKNKAGETIHGLDFYYTGFRSVIAKLENDWDEDGYYTGEFTLMNKSWNDVMEYSLGLKYDKKDREVYTFEFTLKLDNWLEIGTLLEKDRNRKLYIGVDRVFNLKNPKENMNSLENAIIKAVAFIDGNNNNKYDKGEAPVSDVLVEFGNRSIVTDENGIGYIYGIPSYIDYELKISSERPSFKTDSNIIKVRGIGSSEITAYIPVKPMIFFTGNIAITGVTEREEDLILSELEITVTNEEQKFCKIFHPDYEGQFYLYDIVPGIYNMALKYKGKDFKIKDYLKKMELNYTDKNHGDLEYNFILEEESN